MVRTLQDHSFLIFRTSSPLLSSYVSGARKPNNPHSLLPFKKGKTPSQEASEEENATCPPPNDGLLERRNQSRPENPKNTHKEEEAVISHAFLSVATNISFKIETIHHKSSAGRQKNKFPKLSKRNNKKVFRRPVLGRQQ